MRRNDKEIRDPEIIKEIITRSELCRLALYDGSEPYIVPVNFGYTANTIYIHSAPEGRKMEIIRKNNRVCFEVTQSFEIIKGDAPCNWSSKYRSVIGYGKIEILDDYESKEFGLDLIMSKYGGNDHNIYNKAMLDRMLILRLRIEKLTAKQSGNW